MPTYLGATTSAPRPDKQPPLESGDRLTRETFELRYLERPGIHKAELIEGVVYVASPVRVETHARPHAHIITWLGTYIASTPGVQMADNATLRLDVDTEVQPDACMWIDGGRVQISEDDYLEGAPELIIEVAASSASYDLHDKLGAYQRNRVQEYLVLLAYEQRARWHVWADEAYQMLQPDEQGALRSQVFPGLHFHPSRFWAGDLAGVLEVLKNGLETTEHATFVRDLQQE